MPSRHSLPLEMKIVQMLFPQTTNAAVKTQVITLKNAHKAWVVFEFTQAAGFASVPTLNQSTDIAAATNKAGPSVPIWANEDTAATDTLVKKTDAASYTVANDIKKKQVVFEIEPDRLDVSNGYKCIYFTIATSSQATNIVSATAYLENRYSQATPPSAILD